MSLAEELDLPWGARVSPAAEAFLVEAGAEVSYAAASRLLARAGGSRVSATTVMRAVHLAGERCAEQDARAARDLFDLGVKPDGATEALEVCVEADGTWVALQGTAPGEPARAEIKAMAAYSGKSERGGKVAREHVARHGCAAAPSELWPEAVAVLGSEFDLSLLERVHLGTDGEAWCKRGGACFPLRVEVVGHLDPFHIDRALLSCFDDPAMSWQLIEVVRDGGKEEAAALLEACIGRGLARKSAPRVLAYLRNNMGIIAAEGPSLGTMESENQHLYKSRMASVPCAWTREGTSHMARLRSRRGRTARFPRERGPDPLLRSGAEGKRGASWRYWNRPGCRPHPARRESALDTSRPEHLRPEPHRKCATLPPSTPEWPEWAGRRLRERDPPHQSYAVLLRAAAKADSRGGIISGTLECESGGKRNGDSEKAGITREVC